MCALVLQILPENKGFICDISLRGGQHDCIIFFSLNNLLNHVGIMAAQNHQSYQMNMRHARITKYNKIFQA